MMRVTPAMTAPPPDKAMVTFLRPSSFGGLIKFGIWDGTDFVGILTPGIGIQYLAEPGEHAFMARAENWSYLKANLEAGKEYYVVGRVFPGVWKARVAFDPVTREELDNPKFVQKLDTWLQRMRPCEPEPQSAAAYRDRRLGHVQRALDQSDTAAAATLSPEDGR